MKTSGTLQGSMFKKKKQLIMHCLGQSELLFTRAEQNSKCSKLVPFLFKNQKCNRLNSMGCLIGIIGI